MCFVLFFNQKTAYEMRISDWSSDVCSSDLTIRVATVDRRGAVDDRTSGVTAGLAGIGGIVAAVGGGATGIVGDLVGAAEAAGIDGRDLRRRLVAGTSNRQSVV